MVQTKSPIVQGREYNYSGIYDLKGTYNFVKNYLENTKHYDITEKEVEEATSGDKKKLISKLEAEIEYDDYFKIVLTFELKLNGKPIIVEDSKGNKHSLVEGGANITVNGYLLKDHMNKRPKGPVLELLEKMYGFYINPDENKKMAGYVSREVNDLITRFKQQVNSAVK